MSSNKVQEALLCLGLSVVPTSNDSLKRAYQEAAKKSHPDKGGSSELFQKVKNSFEFLSHVVFQNMRKPNPLRVSVHANFEDFYFGSEHILEIQLNKVCSGCSGTGAYEAKKVHCEVCNGTGRNPKSSFSRMAGMESGGICRHCMGYGYNTPDACPTCSGNGVIPEDVRIPIKLNMTMVVGPVRFVVPNYTKGSSVQGSLYVSGTYNQNTEYRLKSDSGVLTRTYLLKPREFYLGGCASIYLVGKEVIIDRIPKQRTSSMAINGFPFIAEFLPDPEADYE